MFGYMTKKEALELGFTHNGTYYGIPIYITPGEYPRVSVKFLPFEYVFDFFSWLEFKLVEYNLYPGDEIPNFVLLDQIESNNNTN